MGFSASQAKSSSTNETYNLQKTVTGAAGDRSPTLSAEGDVTYNDAGGEVSLASLAGMVDVAKLALTRQSDILSQNVADSTAAMTRVQDNSAAQLAQALSSNYQLAQNSQTGGATSAIKQTNLIIWGLIGLAAAAALGTLAWMFRKKGA